MGCKYLVGCALVLIKVYLEWGQIIEEASVITCGQLYCLLDRLCRLRQGFKLRLQLCFVTCCGKIRSLNNNS